MTADVGIHGPVAIASLATIFFLVGVALGRSCSPYYCPVGKHEFRARVTVCDDDRAYHLVPLDGLPYTETSTDTEE